MPREHQPKFEQALDRQITVFGALVAGADLRQRQVEGGGLVATRGARFARFDFDDVNLAGQFDGQNQ